MLGIIDAHDRTIDPVIGFSFLETIVYLIFSILWKVNSNHHSNIKVLLHKVIWFVLISEFVLSLMNSIVYSLMMKFSGNLTLTIITTVIALLMNGCVLFLSCFLSTGVSIVFDTISPEKLSLVIISSFLFAVALALIETLQQISITSALYIFIIVFFIVTYIFYFVILIYSTKMAINALTLHMDIIAERGINPNSSPTFKKMKMLEFTRNFAMVTIFFIVLFYLLFFINIIPFWIVYMIKVIFMISIMGVICYRCRIRQAMAATYGDDDDAYIVNDGSDEQDPENPHNLRSTEIEQNVTRDQPAQHISPQIRKQITPTSEDENCCQHEENLDQQNELYEQNIKANDRTTISDSDCDAINIDSEIESDDHISHNDLNNSNAHSNHNTDSENNFDQHHSDIESSSDVAIVNNSSDGNQQQETKEWTPGTVLPPIPQITNLSNRIYPSDPK